MGSRLRARWLSGLRSLRVLGIDRTDIDVVPEWIRDLESLEELNLNQNRIASLPPNLFELPNLRKLEAKDNQLEHVPTTIGRATKLKTSSCSATTDLSSCPWRSVNLLIWRRCGSDNDPRPNPDDCALGELQHSGLMAIA
jgi:hypothetical protein